MTNPHFRRHPGELADAYIASGAWNADTVWGWLDDWAAKAPDGVAVHEAGGRIHSYADLSRASRRFARALQDIGIGKGDTVAIQLPSCAEFLIAYFGVLRMGAVLVPMHMPYRDGELEPLLRFAEAKAIICAPRTPKYDGPLMMERLRHAVPSLEHVIVGRGEGSGCPVMAEMIDAAEESSAPDAACASDAALMCFTSGTSAAPKGVVHACETLTADARLYVRTLDLSAEDRSMIAPPFSHIFGLECVNNAVYTGGAVLPLEHFQPQAYVDLIAQLRPSVVYSAPAHLAATLKSGALEGRDLSSVRDVILGGSICPPHVAREFEAQLPRGRVGILFGMTESLRVTPTPMDADPDTRHGTVGRTVPGIEARVVGPDGTVLGEGHEGELQLRGCTIMSGYSRNEAATAECFTADGWFRSGDLARLDRDGNITITGRLTDVINRGGVKINPSDIESAIAEHESVVQAGLVPIPDDVLGERICAAVTLVEGKTLELQDLCAFLGSRGIAKARWPERIVVVDEMPMTPTRKIVKSELRRRVDALLGDAVGGDVRKQAGVRQAGRNADA